MDTIEQSRFEDTNKLFQKPTKSPDFIVKTFKDIEDLTSLIGIIKM